MITPINVVFIEDNPADAPLGRTPFSQLQNDHPALAIPSFHYEKRNGTGYPLA
jgi:hypothetical protein